MDHFTLAKIMREQELARRQARNQILLNNAKLADERLTPEEQAVDAEAVKALRKADQRTRQYIYGGYWSRLWAAIRGK